MVDKFKPVDADALEMQDRVKEMHELRPLSASEHTEYHKEIKNELSVLKDLMRGTTASAAIGRRSPVGIWNEFIRRRSPVAIWEEEKRQK